VLLLRDNASLIFGSASYLSLPIFIYVYYYDLDYESGKNWQKLYDVAIIAQSLSLDLWERAGELHHLIRLFSLRKEFLMLMSPLAPFDLIKIFRSFQDPVSRWYKKGSVRGWGRLAALLVAAVFLSFWVASGQVNAGMLFQSPQSPAAQPPAEQPPVEQPAAQPPVEQPPVEQPPAQAPAEQVPVEQSPVQPPVEQAPAPQSPVAQPPAEPAAPAPAEPVQPTLEPVRREREEVPIDEAGGGGPVQFILDQAELIDTMVVSGAYIWLCCGVSLFLLVPLFLLFVYIRGRSKIIREEGY
jgi:hypothetical protein